jgi:hypothetical protein
MTDESHLHRTVYRVDIAGRRYFLVLLALGVAIEACALLPSTAGSRIRDGSA